MLVVIIISGIQQFIATIRVINFSPSPYPPFFFKPPPILIPFSSRRSFHLAELIAQLICAKQQPLFFRHSPSRNMANNVARGGEAARAADPASV